jgi:hypothetical protein
MHASMMIIIGAIARGFKAGESDVPNERDNPDESDTRDAAKMPKTHFDIPPGTTCITKYSLEEWGVDKTKLTSVTIPDSVTVIERGAFAYCCSLVAVTIPSSVTVIREEAFHQCSSLAMMSIPDSVTVIERRAFGYCCSLVAVTIPSSVTVIEAGVFSGCRSLATVSIPDSVTVIEGCAFSNCRSLATVSIPNSVTTIGKFAFDECLSLVAVTIPDSVTIIEAYAFYYCTSLTAVTIPNSVTVIEEKAFFRCSSLTAVTIPDSVTNLAIDAFMNCPILRSIDYGRVTDLTAPNRFPVLNRISRTATVEHPLRDGDNCIVRRTWPASTVELEPAVQEQGYVVTPATYAGTEPEPPTEVVDATGIVSPIPLQDLGGNEFPVHGCWAADRPTADFKALAAAQHPEALGDPATWSVALPEAEVAVDTLDLAAVAMMLARGKLSPDEPWMVVWKDDKKARK